MENCVNTKNLYREGKSGKAIKVIIIATKLRENIFIDTSS
jgi:hypothetical protein